MTTDQRRRAQLFLADDKAPWIRFRMNARPPTLRCGRCGALATTPLPIEVGAFLTTIQTFMRVHRQCRLAA